MFETVKGVCEETITKEKNISLTRDTTASLLSGNVEYSDSMNYSVMIEVYLRKNKGSIGQLKDDSVFLLNEVESNFHEKPIKEYTEKHKYEQSISGYNKWRILIKHCLGETLLFFLKKS